MKNTKIFISCHKPCTVIEHPMLFPVQVGAKNAAYRLEGMFHDDEGENISEKNPMYCELTAQYWAWKNQQDADYFGFFHYRRYMSFSDEKLETNKFQDAELPVLDNSVIDKLNLKPEVIDDYVNKYDIIATTPVVLKKLHPVLDSNYTQYIIPYYQYEEDLDVMLEIIKEKYPNYYDTAEYYMKRCEYGYFCNMFIMRKDIFNDYCSWLFDILAEHEKRRDYSNYSVMGYRVSGYLAERLFGIYYLYHKKNSNIKTIDVQRTLFKNTEKQVECKPAFKENNIPVALAANDFFVPYTATTLQSIICNSSEDKNYDVIILTSDISVKNKTILSRMVSKKKNFSLRFINPEFLISSFDLYTRGHFSIETYYRLVLPEFLKTYDKIVYLDSDMVVEHDVADLYNEDIEGYLLGACYDADTSGLYNGYQPGKKEYTDNVLKLKDPYAYFQAGTLVMNLKEFRNSFTTNEILELSAKEKWQLLDQDILNVLCEGRVKYIDMRWNVMIDYEDKRISDIISRAPHWQNKMYMEARKDPYIIHYAGPDKPWYRANIDFGERFWHYARKGPYYEIILQRMMDVVIDWRTPRPKKNMAVQLVEYRKEYGIRHMVSHFWKRFVLGVKVHGWGYSIKYILKRIFKG